MTPICIAILLQKQKGQRGLQLQLLLGFEFISWQLHFPCSSIQLQEEFHCRTARARLQLHISRCEKSIDPLSQIYVIASGVHSLLGHFLVAFAWQSNSCGRLAVSQVIPSLAFMSLHVRQRQWLKIDCLCLGVLTHSHAVFLVERGWKIVQWSTSVKVFAAISNHSSKSTI